MRYNSSAAAPRTLNTGAGAVRVVIAGLHKKSRATAETCSRVLCSLRWPSTVYVAEDGLEFLTLLSLPPEG